MISVCIPTYNGGKYLEECLESVFNQTYTNFEVIVTDDCSTDNSLEIVQKFAHDKRLRYFRNKKNLGLVGNWNNTLLQANGEWIKFLFQDDLLSANCLQKMVDVAMETGKKIVACSRNFLIENNASASSISFNESRLRTFDTVAPGRTVFEPHEFSELVVKHLYYNFIGEPTAVFFNKNLVIEFGVFNKNLIQLCDYEFWVRLAANVGMAYLPEKLCTFRIHGASTTTENSKNKKEQMQFTEFFVLLHDFLFLPFFAELRKYDVQKRFLGEMIHLKARFQEKLQTDNNEAFILAEDFISQNYPAIKLIPKPKKTFLQRIKNKLKNV